MVLEGSRWLACSVVVLQHRLRWDRWKDVCLCVERKKDTHMHRFLGRGGSGQLCLDAVPETPCSRTLSIDLAIKTQGREEEQGRKSWGIQIETASIPEEESVKDSDNVTQASQQKTEERAVSRRAGSEGEKHAKEQTWRKKKKKNDRANYREGGDAVFTTEY